MGPQLEAEHPLQVARRGEVGALWLRVADDQVAVACVGGCRRDRADIACDHQGVRCNGDDPDPFACAHIAQQVVRGDDLALACAEVQRRRDVRLRIAGNDTREVLLFSICYLSPL